MYTTTKRIYSCACIGPVCIVTGASRGIGAAIALALGSAGARVVVNYAASAGPAEDIAEKIKAAGGDAICVQANVAIEDDVAKLFSEAVSAFGEVNVLVNNAGITRDTLMMRMKMQQWQEVIDCNLTGVFMCCQAGTKAMGKKKTCERAHHKYYFSCWCHRECRASKLCCCQSRRHWPDEDDCT